MCLGVRVFWLVMKLKKTVNQILYIHVGHRPGPTVVTHLGPCPDRGSDFIGKNCHEFADWT